MKRFLAVFLLCVCLSGCGGKDEGLDPMLRLRQKLQSCDECAFTAAITADYGEDVYCFSMDCKGDSKGNVSFTVTAPETIRGITGILEAGSGKITFDDTVLAFEMMADGQLSPVSAPWVFYRSLIGGYLSACAKTGEGYLVSLNDSYEDDALELTVRTDWDGIPRSAEIYYRGKRFLSLNVENFTVL